MNIFEIDLDDGKAAWATELPMEPYGERLLIAADDTEESRKLLQEVSAVWQQLWPQMRARFQDAARELDLDAPVDGDTLICQACRLEPGVFMADRCDTYLSLSSDPSLPSGDYRPDWDFFLKDGQIIHFQPVF